jgi:tetratricopeptide (TPR) repeat protein
LAGNPADGFAHRLMAMVYFEAGKFRLADESIQKAIAQNPTEASHWHQFAYMSYRQGDLVSARKHIARARELNPWNADILNMAILCEPNLPETAKKKIQQYKDALALDPENANLYNNMGIQYLTHLKDFPQAEECFRRALFFDPTSKNARKNLFITVKKRDLIYRILCAPKDALVYVINFFARVRRYNLFLWILMIPLWLLAFRFIIGGLILWFALVWPLTKVYEYLTIGDLRARAGELGAQRGGFLGFRKWPVKFRLSIFALFLISFWGFVVLLFVPNSPLNKMPNSPLIREIFAVAAALGVFTFLIWFLVSWIRRGIRVRSARKRARRLESIVSPNRQR